MSKLTTEEIEEILKRPIVSVVSTIRPDGTPHMTPVWHLVDRGDVVIGIEESSVKARNVRANPATALSVIVDESPQKWILVNGNATLSYDRMEDVVRALSVHYMGVAEGEVYAKQAVIDSDFVLLRITPAKMVGFLLDD